jgi:predicted ATPase
MISELHIENFRSIEKATIDLGRITVLTGANNSGKSSLMYGFFCLRGIILNPNRTLDSLFNIQNVINLGSFKEVVYDKDDSKTIALQLTIKTENIEIYYGFNLNPVSSWAKHAFHKPFFETMQGFITFPFQSRSKQFDIDKSYAKATGEELNLFPMFETIKFKPVIGEDLWQEIDTEEIKNLSFHTFTEFVPIRRGFTKSSFGMVPLQYEIVTEDEIATKIALEIALQDKISHYLEKIADRQFRVRVIANTSVFFLQTTDKETGFTTDLVNEGTGTNQLVTILAKALQPDKKFICIDEPEIHLHPSMIAKLVEALVEIAYEQDKQFLLSTHSEHFVTCLLTEVVKKNLEPDDLKIYYLTKDKKGTQIEHQAVNADGQIEGGLKNFYEAELSNLESFFKLT